MNNLSHFVHIYIEFYKFILILLLITCIILF